uniref:Nicotinamide-nucleotide adenylyltransferase n=4 Tax=Meloidogyne TaxID=189290 RepID=A0A915MZL9_MELJA
MNARILAGSNVVLILCGSFNPPTYLHLRMFERAKDFLQQECKCNVLDGIISPVSDHFKSKKPSLAPSIHRLRMSQLATSSSDWIRADGWECQRKEGWTRTLEVLKYHNMQMLNRYSNLQKLRLILLCGADLVDSFTRKDPTSSTGRLWSIEHLKQILTQYGLIIIERRGATANKTLKSEDLEFLHSLLDNVAIIEEDTFPNEISSTKLRIAVRAGREKLMRQAACIGRKQLGSFGTCLGKFTKGGSFFLHITALDYLAPYALAKIWLKPQAEQQFLYGNNIVKSGVGRMSEGIEEKQGIIVYNMSDLPLGFGVAAKGTVSCKKADPTALVVLHQSDLGEYIRNEEGLI